MKLKCETNTDEVQGEVGLEAVAELSLPLSELQTDFEHGQWWVTHSPTGAQWSVCDTDNGFCFEQVTMGEEE